MSYQPLFRDALEACRLIGHSSSHHLLYSWIYVPCGLTLILAVCFGVDSLIRLSSVTFPASVACMILLFLGLIGVECAAGNKRVRHLVQLLDVPCGFALRHINLLFSPSFILIPLSSPIGGAEIGKIVGVWVIGYFIITALSASMVRTLQYVRGTSKRGLTERAEEVGRERDVIPLTQPHPFSQPSTAAPSASASSAMLAASSVPELQAPLHTQDPAEITGSSGPPESDIAPSPTTILRQESIPVTRPRRWAAVASLHLDRIIYLIILMSIGIPVYFSPGTQYAMPCHLSITILAYFVALSLPATWRRFLHPVLVTALIALVVIWVLAVAHGDSLNDALGAFSTGIRYPQVFSAQASSRRLPGGGDFLSSVLDVSIVALALPMFQYRQELKRNFLSIILPNVLFALGSVFGYPPLCAALGISPARSISFASRSLTLALAGPATSNFGGDQSLVAILCIASGIIGVLLGPTVLKWLKIPEDDYITRGVTLGANSSAMATALLLTTDPRAAAFSSLSMGLFGTVTVAMSSVPPIVGIVRTLAGR